MHDIFAVKYMDVFQVSEERLISMLEQINEQTAQRTKVTIQRRRGVLDDDY